MPIYAIIYTDKGKADNPQTAERVFKMTISNYYVREYLHLYREYRKVINIFDAFLLYGKIEYTLGELRRDFSLDYQCVCCLNYMLLSVKNSKSVFLRMISDFSIRVIYHADGWG